MHKTKIITSPFFAFILCHTSCLVCFTMRYELSVPCFTLMHNSSFYNKTLGCHFKPKIQFHSFIQFHFSLLSMYSHLFTAFLLVTVSKYFEDTYSHCGPVSYTLIYLFITAIIFVSKSQSLNISIQMCLLYGNISKFSYPGDTLPAAAGLMLEMFTQKMFMTN